MQSDKDHYRSRLQSLTQSGVYTFGVKSLSIVLGFFVHVLLAHFLEQDGYGEYVFALTTLNFLVILAVAGGDSIATRFVPKYQAVDDSRFDLNEYQEQSSESAGQLQILLRWLNHRTLFLAGIVTAISVVILQVVRQIDDRQLWLMTQLLVLALPIQAFSLLRQGLLRGLVQPVKSVVPEGFVRPALMIALSALVYYFSGQQNIEFSTIHIVYVYFFASAVTLLVGQALLNRNLPASPVSGTIKASDENVVAWRSMGIASLFSALAMSIHSQNDVWMIGVLSTTDHAGAYGAAAKYSSFVIFGINAVNTALAPMFSSSAGDRKALQELASRGVKLSFLIGLVISLVFLSVPELCLSLFGKGFQEASLSLRILVAANLFNVCCGSVGLLLSMTGHHQLFMRILISSIMLNIGLNFLLIPPYEMAGAAVATTISVCYWNMVSLYFVRKRLKVRPTIGGWI